MSNLHDKQQNDQNVPADLPIRLDRLVDGEVNIDEQRQLLLALEAQPDGWRRCALAYIEAQTLRQELRGIGNSSNEAVEDGQRVLLRGLRARAKRTSSFLGSRRWQWLAMAACFVLAFLIGTATRGLWTAEAGKSQPDKLLATNVGGGNPATVAMTNPTDVTSVKAESVPMIVPSPDGKSEQTVNVPLVEAKSQADWQSFLAQENPVLNDAALATLESTGHVVQQRRAYYPVQLQDGRQAVVPVDLVEVRDTGGWQ